MCTEFIPTQQTKENRIKKITEGFLISKNIFLFLGHCIAIFGIINFGHFQGSEFEHMNNLLWI